jgi:hypothetical protein
LRLPQPCDSKVTVTSQTLPSRETFLRKFSVLASEDYSSQSGEKSNTKPGVGVTLGLYSFMRPASHNNAGVICVVYGGKEHCGYFSYAVLRVCYRFTILRALQSGKPVKDQRAPVSWWLWCELCVVLFHYSTRDCYSIGYREKEIERDLEVGLYVFEF